MNGTHIQPNKLTARSGFTLLELMLAVGLTSILMAAVYSAMSIYWNLALESHEEVERVQVARALLTLLSDDIQSCTFVAQTVTADKQEDDSDNSSGSNPDDVGVSVYKNGLIGTDRDLVLYISRPETELNYVTAPEAVGSTNRDSDLMIVRWLLADAAGSGLAAAIAEQNPAAGTGTVAGLARGSGGVTGFGAAIEQDNVALQQESSTLLAAEVGGLLFEYFDGVDWLAEWDSSTLNKMPQAVRIQLTLRNTGGKVEESDPRILPATTHTLVVRIPVAAPYVEETAL